MDVVSRHEDLAIVDRRITIGRRYHMAVYVELRQTLEQFLDLVHIRLFVDGGVGANFEASPLSHPDALDGFAEHTRALYRDIVILLHPIQVDIEEEFFSGLKLFEALANEHSVGAQVNGFIALDQLRHQRADLRIKRRFTAANGYDWRAAFVRGVKALV